MLNKLVSICCSALVAAALLSLCACAPGGHTAATVQGHEIAEDEITAYIEAYRASMQCEDDSAWASYLKERDYTPESLRSTTIEEFASPLVVKDKADELGLSVDEEAVDSQMSAIRGSMLASDDETWAGELERFGTTEDEMRQRYANRNLKEQVFERIAKDITPTDDDIDAYVQDKLLGASTKKLACIYSSDYSEAQKALDTVTEAKSAGEGFERAREDVDEKTSHYEDLGWDLTSELTASMVKAVAEIDKGQVADSLLSENGVYFLFYVADEYTFPADAAKVSFPDKRLKQSVSDLAAQQLKETAGNVWLKQQIEGSLSIYPMPSGLSYDVDMGLAADAADEDAGSSSGDGSE